MSEREILIADSDGTVRNQLADSFRSEGFDVETTDSTAHLFSSVLEKRIPVVLLGSDCDRKIALANLIPLLKQCNKGVAIILVSDEESLPTIRSVRQEGIFYHALKPTGKDDTEELLTAVRCAFEKSERTQMVRPIAKQVLSPSATPAAIPLAAAQVIPQALEELPETVQVNPSGESREEKKIRAKAATIVGVLTVTVAGFVYCAGAAIKGMKESGDFMTWAFFGFCALIAVGQLLPAFFRVREARKEIAQRLRGNVAVADEKQHP